VVSFSDAAAAVLATVAIPPEQYLAPSQRQRPFEAGAQHSVRVPVSLSNKKLMVLRLKNITRNDASSLHYQGVSYWSSYGAKYTTQNVF